MIGTLSGHILKTEHAQYRYPTVAVTMYLIFFDNWTSSEKQGFTHMGVSFLDNPTHLPSALCPFPLKHAWGNLDAPIGRLRGAQGVAGYQPFWKWSYSNVPTGVGVPGEGEKICVQEEED